MPFGIRFRCAGDGIIGFNGSNSENNVTKLPFGSKGAGNGSPMFERLKHGQEFHKFQIAFWFEGCWK